MFLLPVFFLIVIDQYIKFVIAGNLNPGDKLTVIQDFFYISHQTNQGAAWGMMQGMNFIFLPVTVVVVGFIIYLMFRNRDRLFRIAGVMVLAGAVGNFIDRVFRAEGVIDFLEFHFGTYVFPIFNFADILIVCGSILLGIYLLFFYKGRNFT